MRYHDRSPASPPFPRRAAPRRRQQRVSARISARPVREPSLGSSGSSPRTRSRSPSSRSPCTRPERGHTGTPIQSEGMHAPPPLPTTSSAFAAPASAHVPAPSSTPSSSFTFYPATYPPRDVDPPFRKPPASPCWSTQSSIRSSAHSSPHLVTTELNPSTPSNASPDAADATEVSPPRSVPPMQEDAELELPGMLFLEDGALKPGLEAPNLNTVLEIAMEPPVDDISMEHEGAKEAAVEADTTMSLIITTEIPKPPQVIELDSPVEEAPSSALSPLSTVPQSADHSLESIQTSQSSPLMGEQPLEPILKDHDFLQEVRNRNDAVESIRQGSSHVEPPDAIGLVLGAPESSPLSEPIPLSPLPEFPPLQEEDDESSMEIDDDDSSASSSSSSSSSSGPAGDIAASLRVFVKARDGKDSQSRNERYAPILRTNHAILDAPYTRISTSNEELVEEMLTGSLYARLETHAAVSRTLLDRFTKQTDDLAVRTRQLREEYKAYHDQWVANCRKLDQSMASSASQGVEGLPVPSGRVTRRSAAFGDAVRSDLEMEQIIASLGNEDMTDPNVLAIRNTAKIPDLVSTDPFAVNISFDDDNGLVDDPAEVFDMYDALGRWTNDEKDTFVQKYAIYPKQFGAIASFLPNKTPGQCVMFYYLHKKELIDFRAAISKYGPKRKRGRKAGKGKGNALLADIVKPLRPGADDEGTSHKHSGRFLADSHLEGGRFPSRRLTVVPDGEVGPSRSNSTAVRGSRLSALQQETDLGSDGDSARSSRQRRSGPSSLSEDGTEAGTVVVATIEDRRKRQARVAIAPPQEKAFEPEVDLSPAKKPKSHEKGKEKEKRPPGRPPKKSKERARALEKAGGSPLTTKSTSTSYVWSKGEEAIYLELLARHGKNFDKISGQMPAKTAIQCRNYFRNHAKELDLERVAKESNSSVTITELATSNNSSASASKDNITKFKESVNGDTGATGSHPPRPIAGSKQLHPSSGGTLPGYSEWYTPPTNMRNTTPTKELAHSQQTPNLTQNRP